MYEYRVVVEGEYNLYLETKDIAYAELRLKSMKTSFPSYPARIERREIDKWESYFPPGARYHPDRH